MEKPLLPLRSLAILANPVDLPRFDAEFLWAQMSEALQSFQERGSLILERLRPPSTTGLRTRLAGIPWNVLHFVVHGQERAAARYGTIALLSSDGRSGSLTAQALAGLLSPCASGALAILQSADDGVPPFDIVGEELIARGFPAVAIVSSLRERSQNVFLSRLYSGLLQGFTSDEIASDLVAAGFEGKGPQGVRILSRDASRPLLTLPVSDKLTSASMKPDVGSPSWQDIVRMKQEAEAFDVFLCHNSADKPAVRRIGQRLREAGLLPWLDVEQLPPGQPWQPLLEKQIKNIRSAAVCFGSAGIGPWQEREMYGFLSAFVSRGVPVIPLLLADAPAAPELPVFLTQMTWVDFRSTDSDPLSQLIWGITGKRPEVQANFPPTPSPPRSPSA